MSEERDPADGDAGEDPAPAEQPGDSETTCTECGASIETSDWYPIRTDRADDGDLRLYPFCSEDCQDAWLDERD